MNQLRFESRRIIELINNRALNKFKKKIAIMIKLVNYGKINLSVKLLSKIFFILYRFSLSL